MDYEEKKRRQFIRVLIAETGMVISVIAIVVLTMLAAMGFFISKDGQIEQGGLLQLHSLPTGATVELDNSTLFARTNLDRSIPSGPHTLKLSRENYDTWEKTINVNPGILFRLYYPRLFPQNREAASVLSLTTAAEKADLAAASAANLSPTPTNSYSSLKDSDLAFFLPSINRNFIAYAFKNSTKLYLIDIRSDAPKVNMLDLSDILPFTTAKTRSADASFSGTFSSLEWSRDSSRLLAKIESGAEKNWLLIDLNNPKKSLNLTTTFGINFDRIAIIDGSASSLFALENHHLRRISVSDGSLSKILLSDVDDFDNTGSSIIYTATPTAAADAVSAKHRVIGVYRDGEEGSTIITEVSRDTPVKVAIAHHYDDDYICYTVGQKLTIYFGDLPHYNSKTAESPDLSSLEPLLTDEQLSTSPEKFVTSPNNAYLIAKNGQKFMVVDLYLANISEYEAPSRELRWLDDSMMYMIKDQKITVWDFDGTNRRDLSSSQAKFTPVLDRPVVITSDNTYLYYLSTNLSLTRERIRD